MGWRGVATLTGADVSPGLERMTHIDWSGCLSWTGEGVSPGLERMTHMGWRGIFSETGEGVPHGLAHTAGCGAGCGHVLRGRSILLSLEQNG